MWQQVEKYFHCQRHATIHIYKSWSIYAGINIKTSSAVRMMGYPCKILTFWRGRPAHVPGSLPVRQADHLDPPTSLPRTEDPST